MKTAIVVLTLSSMSAQPIPATGTTLIGTCSVALGDATTRPVGAGVCLGIVHGVGDVLNSEYRVDLPDGYTTEQGVRVVMKYLQDHPEELADRDSTLVVRALTKAFPPKKKT
jgi:hypothetical protein